MKYLLAILPLLLSSCTYSLNVVHTQGSAADVVDEQHTPTANVSATVPIKGL